MIIASGDSSRYPLRVLTRRWPTFSTPSIASPQSVNVGRLVVGNGYVYEFANPTGDDFIGIAAGSVYRPAIELNVRMPYFSRQPSGLRSEREPGILGRIVVDDRHCGVDHATAQQCPTQPVRLPTLHPRRRKLQLMSNSRSVRERKETGRNASFTSVRKTPDDASACPAVHT